MFCMFCLYHNNDFVHSWQVNHAVLQIRARKLNSFAKSMDFLASLASSGSRRRTVLLYAAWKVFCTFGSWDFFLPHKISCFYHFTSRITTKTVWNNIPDRPQIAAQISCSKTMINCFSEHKLKKCETVTVGVRILANCKQLSFSATSSHVVFRIYLDVTLSYLWALGRSQSQAFLSTTPWRPLRNCNLKKILILSGQKKHTNPIKSYGCGSKWKT